MAEALENDPRNPCIGCGPSNPLGLHLTFAREGNEVVATLHAGEHLQGWPERLHSGVLYLALLETANWAFFGLTGKVGVPAATSALDAKRLARTGEALRLSGTLRGPDEVEARALAGDEVVASLTRRYKVLGRAAFLETLGYERMPAVFEDGFR